MYTYNGEKQKSYLKTEEHFYSFKKFKYTNNRKSHLFIIEIHNHTTYILL